MKCINDGYLCKRYQAGWNRDSIVKEVMNRHGGLLTVLARKYYTLDDDDKLSLAYEAIHYSLTKYNGKMKYSSFLGMVYGQALTTEFTRTKNNKNRALNEAEKHDNLLVLDSAVEEAADVMEMFDQKALTDELRSVITCISTGFRRCDTMRELNMTESRYVASIASIKAAM
jgi:hypothetical protein